MQFPDEGLLHKFSMEQGLRTLPAVLALIQKGVLIRFGQWRRLKTTP